MAYLFLVLAIFSEVAATLSLKASNGWQHTGYGMASIGLYTVAGIFLSFTLKSMSVGITYAIWSGVGIALVCIASVYLWQQKFDGFAYAGITLIGLGTLLITVKSNVVIQ
ncbi:MAG: QacE family quaternary ammonium compound efflux SMR transporter [Colwelliaceae bacterium]|nr:QacE family quaternary ammonium compound efflux SMR transporter [Colwelliaceae bacterium]|tara:strand:- start:1013 stop:1342 length:330 start_codon:yes stop_codon:yes gene_type:complete